MVHKMAPEEATQRNACKDFAFHSFKGISFFEIQEGGQRISCVCSQTNVFCSMLLCHPTLNQHRNINATWITTSVSMQQQHNTCNLQSSPITVQSNNTTQLISLVTECNNIPCYKTRIYHTLIIAALMLMLDMASNEVVLPQSKCISWALDQ